MREPFHRIKNSILPLGSRGRAIYDKLWNILHIMKNEGFSKVLTELKPLFLTESKKVSNQLLDQWIKDPERIIQPCRRWAKKFNVVPDIHPKDFLFYFLLSTGKFENYDSAVKYYFEDAKNSATHLYKLIYDELKYQQESKLKILEFASGYGCVTRHLNVILGNNVEITSCDIHQEAMDFIAKKMKIKTILSNSIPEKLQISETSDIVFALSFFSHMPYSTWGRWIEKLFACVAKPGYFIFTTHSTESLKFFGYPQIPASGFWFRPDSEQKDLDKATYGLTVTTPEFVERELYKRTKSKIILFKHAFWWGHQDLYVVENS